jgi:hypothetical protein
MVSALLPSMTFLNRRLEPGKAFHVVIVYENDVAGSRAIDLHHVLLSQFGHEFDFQLSIWSFNALYCTKLNQDAVRDAIDATAIILAIDLGNELPVEIRKWIDAWVPKKIGQPALLIALLGPDRNLSAARDYLRNAAIRADMDFLVEIQHSKNGNSPPLPPNRLAFEGWGLNE